MNTLAQRVRDLTLWLVGIASVNGTPGEAACARALHAHLAALPYFRQHPEHLTLAPTHGDDRERYNVIALVRGGAGCGQGVLLTGHLDTVPVDNYGLLAPHALDPAALAAQLPAHLTAAGEAEAEALADLHSGEYLFGRGALDMKSGVAVGLALLERFAADPAARGCLVLVVNPDEEDGSRGMIAAVQDLPALLAGWGVTPVAAINLDAHSPRLPGDTERLIYTGSVGKLLLSVYLRGVESHTGRPLAGFNPALAAAAVTRRLECSAALADADGGEVAAPPTCLRQVDRKAAYDVTQPPATWAYYNLLNLRRTPAEALALTVAEVSAALDETVAYLQAQAAAWAARAGQPAPALPWRPRVLTHAELQAAAMAGDAAGTSAALADLAVRCGSDPAVDSREYSLRATELLWQRAGLPAPAAVVGIASLYYPAVLPPEGTAAGRRLLAACGAAARAEAAESGYAIGLSPWFWGISDMSFLSGSDSPEALALVAANSPALGARYTVDSAAARLGVPVVNIGPWGKDAHRPTERVHTPYSFGVLPRLVWRVAAPLLAGYGMA